MEAPMKRGYYIGLDAHKLTCEFAVVRENGRLVQRVSCRTAIDQLAAFLKSIPRPRYVVMEEGPMADWLWRNLQCFADGFTVCDPFRNQLIAKDGDKDDPIDAGKLAELLRGGFVKAVHHPESLEQALFKQHVQLYHDRVRHRVAESHRVSSLLRRHGVMVRASGFGDAEQRAKVLDQLPKNTTLREDVNLLWQAFDAAVAQENGMRRRLQQQAKSNDVISRFAEVPGIAWIRAATIYVFLDTPWRFRSKAALWKYMGIGLERRTSGSGPVQLQVPKRVNRLLKSTILGAAKTAAALEDNPFAVQYGRYIEAGLSKRLARRSVARGMAATLWGLWKNGSAYRSDWVGVAAAAMRAAEVSL
jgi:transposase